MKRIREDEFERILNSKVNLILKRFHLKILYFFAWLMGNYKYFTNMIFSRNKFKATVLNSIEKVFEKEKASKQIKRIARQSLIEQNKYMFDTIYVAYNNKRKIEETLNKNIHFSGEEYLKDVLDSERGVIIVSAHIGSFFLCLPILGRLFPSERQLNINIIRKNYRKVIAERIYPKFTSRKIDVKDRHPSKTS